MAHMELAMRTFQFASSLFDVGSDVINSLTFMGYYNPTNYSQINPSTSFSFENQSSVISASGPHSNGTTITFILTGC